MTRYGHPKSSELGIIFLFYINYYELRWTKRKQSPNSSQHNKALDLPARCFGFQACPQLYFLESGGFSSKKFEKTIFMLPVQNQMVHRLSD